MRLIDNSGGIWSEIILRRKSMNLVIKQRVIPDDQLTKGLGLEAIDSVKGGPKHKFVIKSDGKGGVVFHRFTSGTYKYGIQKRISPDGKPYVELNKATIRHREFKGIARGAAFILRETSSHILNGLKILKQARAAKGGKSIEIGWIGEDEKLAQLHDKGGEVTSSWFNTEKTSEIPARPLRGFQPEFVENFRRIMLDFFKQ